MIGAWSVQLFGLNIMVATSGELGLRRSDLPFPVGPPLAPPPAPTAFLVSVVIQSLPVALRDLPHGVHQIPVLLGDDQVLHLAVLAGL